MELRVLRHATALAQRLSYTKAAEELGLTQSALSRSIQALERDAGTRLFDRDRGGVHLTPVGRMFIEQAAALLRDADELGRSLKRAASGEQGEIAFGMAPLPAAALLAEALAENLSAKPNLRSQISVRQADGLVTLLLAEKVEFIVCAEGQLPSTLPVKSAALGAFPSSLLVRPGHPLLDSTSSDLGSFPTIMAATPSDMGEVETYVARHQFQKPRIFLEDPGLLAQITARTDAVWIWSSFAAADYIRAGQLCELPLSAESRVSFQVCMYSLDRRSLSPAAIGLRDQFRASIRRLAQQIPTSATPNMRRTHKK